MECDKVYLQKTKPNSLVVETIKDFDIYCSKIPFKTFSDVKDPSKRDWYDEHGDDEYLPDSGLKMKAYKMDVDFCCKGTKGSVNAKINSFLAYLNGSDGSGVEMKMYCTLTKIGRSGVRFNKISDNAVLDRSDDGDILKFTVSFKVNDPVTEVTPTYNQKEEVIGLSKSIQV